MLKIEDLSVRIRETGKVLVDNVSFQVEDGESFAIIGESGSGKSMTSKTIMGLLNFHKFDVSGYITWKEAKYSLKDDRAIANYRGKEICMIPQNPMTAFAPMIKLGKQIEMETYLKSKTDKIQFHEMMRETLRQVNLLDYDKIVNSYPAELSGGMLQRIMIAMAMLHNPQFIIADEITTAVDAVNEFQIINELEKLRNKGISMIVITHDFGVAARLCSSVAVMKDGVFVEQGDLVQVFKNPQHEYTKKLVDSSILFQEGI